MSPQAKVEAARQLIARARQIKHRMTTGGVRDLMDWMDDELEQLDMLLDEMGEELHHEYPDRQRILNAEHEKLLEVPV